MIGRCLTRKQSGIRKKVRGNRARVDKEETQGSRRKEKNMVNMGVN